jgi:putative adenylate-forming enzyme
MRVGYNIKKFRDVTHALFIAKDLKKHEQWTREELEKLQRRKLFALVRYAVRNSPFYRDVYAHINTDQPFDLHDLPVIDKAMMMKGFDQFVTDSRLKLADLEEHISRITRDEYYLGKYRVFTTSGSTGFKGVFVVNRKEWSTAIAGGLRCAAFAGVSPHLPNRWRMALIGSSSPMHVTHRFYVSSDVGLHRFMRLEATSSLKDMVSSLNAFQPEWLSAYPSIAALLAVEQLEGHLNIHPRVVTTNSEVRTRDMEEKIREAWGVSPFNTYGMTEAGLILGADCPAHRGIHLYEDLFIVEVMDRYDRAVQDGSHGHKLLITNLFNFTQPLIRYEISDMVTMSTDACPCGRPFRMVAWIEGRSDDVIYLGNREGQKIPVHPIHFHNAMGSVPEIRQYQVVCEPDGIHLNLVLPDVNLQEKAAATLREKLRRSLESLGAVCPDIHVRFIDTIERDPQKMGKLKLIQSRVAGN